MLGLSGGSQTNIKAVITADDKASDVLKGFGDRVGSVGHAVEKGLKTAAVAVAAATAAATAFGVASVKAFSESEDLIAQTNAVLKSTGNAAGVTADQVTKLATALQKTTKFSDEDVRSAENLLLTFTSIGKDVFPQATTTVLDMATALGEDTKSASIQLGKALQDPILGVTALRRVGVNFNQTQLDVIKNLVDTGQSAQAQQLILKELNKEFGGSAEAAGNTFSGSLAKLKNSLNDVQEKIGEVIVTKLSPFILKALQAVAAIDWGKVIDKTIAKIREFRDWLGHAYDKMKEVADIVAGYLSPKLEALWNTFNEKLVPALSRFWDGLKTVLPILGGALVIAVGAVIDALNILLTVLAPVLDYLGRHPAILQAATVGLLALAAGFVAVQVAAAIGGVISAVTTAIGLAAGAATTGAGAMGVLRAALILLQTPWVVALGIVGVGVVIAGIESINGALDKLNNKWDDMKKKQVALPNSNIKVSGGSDVGIYAQMRSFFGFASGGFTGQGGTNEVAGVVHRGEYVVPKSQVNQSTGLPMGGGGSPVNVTVSVGLYAGSDMEMRKLTDRIAKTMQDVASARGISTAELLGV